MHLMMILTALMVAAGLRIWGHSSRGNWEVRWQRSLFVFLFPPLLIFMTAIAVLLMGPQGKMGGVHTGWLSYELALTYLAFLAFLCIGLGYQGWQSLAAARKSPLVEVGSQQVRLLEIEAPFAGQIGFWQPELVVSQGLLKTLSPAHVDSVLAHEQGHCHYRDTFWFFWLGWVRACTAWLPNTDVLWDELLVLRELRADNYAALRVDPLLLAESLLLVVKNDSVVPEICCAALGSRGGDRLEQRIEALLSTTQAPSKTSRHFWNVFCLAFLPLLTVIFHTL